MNFASEELQAMRNDPVNHPAHYTSHPSGVECIQITRHMSFSLGNAVKYSWRNKIKHADPLLDLRKACFYIQDAINNVRSLHELENVSVGSQIRTERIWDGPGNRKNNDKEAIVNSAWVSGNCAFDAESEAQGMVSGS